MASRRAQRFRILSLDGGGTWVLIQARALAQLYGADTDGWTILDQFDFGVANSGGTLIMSGLLKGLTPREIIAILRDGESRGLAFRKENWLERHFSATLGVGPKYYTPGKLEGLRSIFSRNEGRCREPTKFAGMTPPEIAKELNADRTKRGLTAFHFLFVGFDFDSERAAFFRSDSDSSARSARPSDPPSIAGAVHASTNAPVNYFDRPAEVALADGTIRNFWDGAVGGYNNPLLAGVIEALAADQARRGYITALSIGSASNRLPVVAKKEPGTDAFVIVRQRPGGFDAGRIIPDLRKMATAILDDPPDAATFIAHVALGEDVPERANQPIKDTRIVRMNPMIQPRLEGMDPNGRPRWVPHEWFREESSVAGEYLFDRLVKMDMDATEQDDVEDILRLADLWLKDEVPNQPIRADQYFRPEIGQAWFSEAAKRWRAIAPA